MATAESSSASYEDVRKRQTRIRDMFEFLKSKTFGLVASFILGLGVVAVLVPRCTDASCKSVKAPNIEEVTKPVYQIGEKCYKFHPKTEACPADGAKVVEPFVRDSLL